MTENKTLNHNSGFTLIELLTSVFIIVFLSSVFMVNYHNTNRRSGLNVAKQKLASDIRLAQNYSLGSKTYDGVYTPKGGWGVHFDLSSPSNYIIFADKNEPSGNQTYDMGEAVEIKTLPAGVSLFSLDPGNQMDIVFFPPNPDIYLNGDDVFTRPIDTATIVLRENINNSTAAVEVNYFGLINTP